MQLVDSQIFNVKWTKVIAKSDKVNNCCVFRTANACLRMCSHGRKQWKTLKNHEKSSQTLHEPLIRMMEKVLFSRFSNVFHCLRPCKRICSLVKIHKRQLSKRMATTIPNLLIGEPQKPGPFFTNFDPTCVRSATTPTETEKKLNRSNST